MESHKGWKTQLYFQNLLSLLLARGHTLPELVSIRLWLCSCRRLNILIFLTLGHLRDVVSVTPGAPHQSPASLMLSPKIILSSHPTSLFPIRWGPLQPQLEFLPCAPSCSICTLNPFPVTFLKWEYMVDPADRSLRRFLAGSPACHTSGETRRPFKHTAFDLKVLFPECNWKLHPYENQITPTKKIKDCVFMYVFMNLYLVTDTRS